MARPLVERKLIENGERLKKLRQELQVAEEQLLSLAHDADDARLRSLVSETALADREHRNAARHADAMTRARDDLKTEIVALEKQQDELLDQMSGS